MATDRLPRASLLEIAGFNALVIVPNVVQGLFRKRAPAVRTATAADVDGKAAGLLKGMSRRYDGGPVWVRAGLDEALLLLDPVDIARVLEGPVDVYAADPDAKRKGMVHFQPDALTISRGDQWASRRRFADAVLTGAGPPGGLASHIEQVTREEIRGMLGEVGDELTWQPWNRALQRITRRVVLGDAAAGDWALTDTLERMMGGANSMPGKPSDDLAAFTSRIEAYLSRAEDPSLASLFADAPSDELTAKSGQVTHWLFALGDTLAINALRVLALLATHPDQRKRAIDDDTAEYVQACLHEAMRLWPTTPMLSRTTLTDVEWGADTVPAGTQILIVNTYSHRDSDRLDFADSFTPEAWTEGDAASNPAFNHFSRGPQGCPGSALALLVGRVAVRIVLEREITLRAPALSTDEPLPHMLDFFGIRLRLE